MRRRLPLLLLALASSAAPSPMRAAGAPEAPSPVVVELFTSQGCSTCPPADRLLSQLGAEGGNLVPLAFHVDFWNHLGWSDPFSNAEWSRRQEAYAQRLGSPSYTPEAVVGGMTGMVGSNEGQMRTAIAAAGKRPTARVALTLEPGEKKLRTQVEVELPPTFAGRKLDLLVALYENGLVTTVARGENGGHELREDYVVRTLVRAARLGGKAGSSHHEVDLRLSPQWSRERLGVAAFLQDPASLEIVGATSSPRLP